MTTNKRIGAGALLIGLLTFGIVLHASGQRAKDPDREAQWEYLVVAGGNANLSTATAGNESYPGMRKQPDTSFGREFFPLERNLDKLGAKGWELVDVHGTPNEPVYFLKRLKEAK
jgi:hypothetical protein